MNKEQKHLSQIKKRYRQEKTFKALSLSAIILASSFLIFFLADITKTGYPALYQTEILTPVTYSEKTVKFTHLAVPNELNRLVSRGFTRLIPMEVKANPELMGQTIERWIIADDEVDQYIKDKPNRLKDNQIAIITKLQEEGRIKKAFNSGFFTRGDSKLPEIAGIFSLCCGFCICAFPYNAVFCTCWCHDSSLP